ncbi:hypothetical protein C8R45DRAFT_1220735 [Mycena sanguinolenta]|nr:hypothetical protein C8R45DRAFT_1220735 [Mycena sanguinolenta]
MHRSLRIPEVVALICKELLPLGYPSAPEPAMKETSATLAAFARTCKAFSGPALDILWREPSVHHVLNCLPSEVWGGLSDDAHFRVPVAASDWERVLVYSRRARSFIMKEDLCSPKALETLRFCFPGQLFPNIEDVTWLIKGPLFPHIPIFLGPRLTGLTLGYFSTVAHLSGLTIVAMQCPFLKDVGIAFSDGLLFELDAADDTQLAQRFRSVSSFVQSLKHLRTLGVPSLDRAALEHIAQLPTFQVLDLTKQYRIITTADPANTSLVTNPETNLTSLIMTGTTIAVLSEILKLLGHAPISYLKATFPKSTRSQDIARFYASLATHCPHSSSISELDIGIPGHRGTEAVPRFDWIVGGDLGPLFSFCNMARVVLSGPAGVYMNDPTMEQLARAWPRLEVLKLYPSSDVRREAPSASIITLAGLLHLARHCPDLTTLHLTLNAAAPVPQLKRSNERIQQRRLESLHVFRSSLAAQDRVTVFLSSVFPGLGKVTSDHLARDRLFRHWNRVHTTLPTFRMVREEEEHWAEVAVASVTSSFNASQDISLRDVSQDP